MSSTLVIGCGFIGSNLVAALADRGETFTVLTRRPPPAEIAAAIGAAGLWLGDAADPKVVAASLAEASRVVYCAGGLLPAASERDPDLDRRLTLAPLETTLKALERHPDVLLTYLSSGGTVYGEPIRIPAHETDPAAPISAYGRLHLACEEMIAAARRNSGLRARVLRCATVYGEHQQPDRGQGAIVTFLHRIESGEQIDLFGGGSTVRDYVYVGDVAQAIIETMDSAEGPDLVNVGSGEGTSLLEILRLAEAQVGRRAKVASHPERGFDVHRIVLDPSRLRAITDFQPTSLEDGIARTHRWLLGAAGPAA
ncbi:MAG TPA: NAD-dependent epimerase/dehydratase family protein [Solirubrobacterales bacterium]